MKNILLSLIIFFFHAPVFAQEQVHFGTIQAPDSLNAVFGSYVLDFYGATLYSEAKKGNILLYRDEEFQKPVSLNAIDLIFMKVESMSIINPLNPDDPYDLIDTAIRTWQNPTNWLDIRIGENFVRLMPVPNRVAYIKKDDFRQLLYGKLIWDCLATDTVLLHSGNNFGLAVKRFYDQLQWELFSKMREYPDLLYESKECTRKDVYPFGFWNVNSFCEDYTVPQIRNPANPEDPYDLIDTVITHPASSSTLTSFIYGIKSSYNGNSSLHSVSFNCRCNEENFHPDYLNEGRPQYYHYTFFIKLSDLEKKIGKEIAEYITFNYVWILSNR